MATDFGYSLQLQRLLFRLGTGALWHTNRQGGQAHMGRSRSQCLASRASHLTLGCHLPSRQALLRNVFLLDEAKQSDARLLARYVRR